MMADYLLPCSCGRKVPVSTRHAGHTVRCQCGVELEVPTLRGLSELERAESVGRPTRGDWGNQHRLVFAFVVGAVVCFGFAAFMAVRLPAKIELSVVEIDADTPISTVYEVYYDLQRGVDVDPPTLSIEGREMMKLRELLLWGIRIALAAGGICTAGAIAVMLSGRSQKR
jgi:hypothetical protein